jgi:BCD family chlorophyll transporter-like MFS transporter
VDDVITDTRWGRDRSIPAPGFIPSRFVAIMRKAAVAILKTHPSGHGVSRRKRPEPAMPDRGNAPNDGVHRMSVSGRVVSFWVRLGPRFLPFADVATPDLPLSRLLRLSLFQVSVGMALVLLIGTLNRVMIVELHVPASLVAIMLSLPLVFAPFRALIGFRSDVHRSMLGWRRVPFIWMGTLIQFGGLAIMPFAILVLSGYGESRELAPIWLGHAAAALAFLLVGAGLHTTQTVGLALATDLVPDQASQPKVVGLMYVMLLLGMGVSAVIFGLLLQDFNAGKLIQVIQGSAVATMALNLLALWKQETRNPAYKPSDDEQAQGFREAWDLYINQSQALRRLLVIGLGTMAFSMQDVLLEPYGGQILGLTVGSTTLLTATLAFGGLIGFGWASKVLSRGADPARMSGFGALAGLPGFALVIIAAPLASPPLFAIGALLIGFGGGLFGHGTLTATMNLAPPEQAGLALGAWGAVQATAAGTAMGLGGVLRDVAAAAAGASPLGPAIGYMSVYVLEIMLLLATLVALVPLLRRRGAERGGHRRLSSGNPA